MAEAGADLAALEAEIARLRASLRYRAADILVEGVRSPRALVRVPARLARLAAEARRVRAWRRVVTAGECGLPDDPMRSMAPPARSASRRLVGGGADHPAAARFAELEALTRTGGLLPPTPAPVTLAAPGPIAYLAHAGLPDATNGYAQRTQAVAGTMRRLGADVTVLLRGGAPGETATVAGVPYRRIGPVPTALSYEDTARTYAAAAASGARAIGAAVVHAASNHLTGQAGGLAAATLGVPFVYEVRGLWEVTRLSTEPAYERAPGFAAQRALEVGTARAASAVFVNGEALSELLATSGVPASRLHPAPNGYDAPDRLPTRDEREAARARLGVPDGGGPVVGFAGSLTAYEGLDLVLRAVARLRREGLFVRLLIVGDGPARAGLEALADGLRLGGACRFTGPLPADVAALAMRAADIAPVARLPSAVGRLTPPLKPLEAMANGAALIVSDLPPLAPLAAGGRGRVVRAGDEAALRDAIGALGRDPAGRAEMAATAHAWVRTERSWDQIARRVLAAYPFSDRP